jgi:hypothetical protein
MKYNEFQHFKRYTISSETICHNRDKLSFNKLLRLLNMAIRNGTKTLLHGY